MFHEKDKGLIIEHFNFLDGIDSYVVLDKKQTNEYIEKVRIDFKDILHNILEQHKNGNSNINVVEYFLRFHTMVEEKIKAMKIEASNVGECEECGAHLGHSPLCGSMSDDYAKAELKRYYLLWLEKEKENRRQCSNINTMGQKKVNRLKNELTRWMGKFMTVKTENNHLRQTIEKCKKKKDE